MTRKRVFVQSPDVEKEGLGGRAPGIQVKFKGKYEKDYYDVHRIALNCFGTTGTNLARQILHDWLKRYTGETEAGKAMILQQTRLSFVDELEYKPTPAALADKVMSSRTQKNRPVGRRKGQSPGKVEKNEI